MSNCDCGPMRAPGGLGLTGLGLRLLDVPEGGAVIDIGCGAGETVRFLSDKGFSRVAGVDCDPALCGPGITTADAAALPFEDRTFDAALFECSLSKMDRPEAALGECRRVLRRKGRVLVADLYARGESAVLGGFLGRVERYEDIRRMVESLGFRETHFEDRSRELLGMWSSLVFQRGADELKIEIGADADALRRIKCGYFLAVFEKTPSPVDARIAATTGAADADALRAWQLRQIRGQLALAKKSRFGARRFENSIPENIRDFSDFEELPFTTAEDLTGSENDFLCVPPGDIRRIVSRRTSGTSGEPKRLCFTVEDILRTEDFFVSGLKDLVRGGERAAVYMSNAAPDGIGDLLRRALLRLGVETRIHGAPSDLGTAATAGHGCSLFVGLPHDMRALAGAAPGLRPRFVLLSADYIPESLAAGLERIWGTRVIRHFGMTETCFGGAVGCARGGGQHIRHADFYFEIINPATGKPVPPGEFGELVLTTLRSEAMPLIRYRTGDIARLEYGTCACGGTFPRLGRVLGRANFLKNPLNIHALDEFMYGFAGLSDYRAEYDGDRLLLSVSGQGPGADELYARFGVRAELTGFLPNTWTPGEKRRLRGEAPF